VRASTIAIAAAIAMMGLSSCRRGPVGPRYVITYYDRNGDGIVDSELHRAPGWADADWGFSDSDFNQSYDILFVVSPFVKNPIHVQVPVPFGVPITKKLPEGFIFDAKPH